MVKNQINNQVDSIQVILDKRIPLKLLQVSEGDNVIYCKKFTEQLFDTGLFSTKEKDFVHNYITENEQKYIITDVSTEDGKTYKNVKFKVIITESEEIPYSTFSPKNENIINEKVVVPETPIVNDLQFLEKTKKNESEIIRIQQAEERLENKKNRLIREENELLKKQKFLKEEKEKSLQEQKEKEKEIENKYKIIREAKDDIIASSRQYLEEKIKASSEENKNYARRILELGGGGGSIAVQYANGGTVNGDLNINNLYPNTPYGKIGSAENRFDKIYANTVDSLSSNIVIELSGFYVDGDFTVNGLISSVNGNSKEWNSVYSTVKSLSDSWEESLFITPLQEASGSWNSVYTTTNLNSSSWNSVYTNLRNNSANYILDGGNSKGSTIMIGTNDNFNLHLETGNTVRVAILSTGQVGIGTLNPIERLSVSGNISGSGNITMGGTGSFNHVQANTKSFYIDHPTQTGKKLQYGSLESPYHGVRLTGESVVVKGECTVKLPDYTHGLVREEGINIQITNIQHSKIIYVNSVDIKNNEFTVKMDTGLFDSKKYKFFWSFSAIRKDIPELVVEL